MEKQQIINSNQHIDLILNVGENIKVKLINSKEKQIINGQNYLLCDFEILEGPDKGNIIDDILIEEDKLFIKPTSKFNAKKDKHGNYTCIDNISIDLKTLSINEQKIINEIIKEIIPMQKETEIVALTINKLTNDITNMLLNLSNKSVKLKNLGETYKVSPLVDIAKNNEGKMIVCMPWITYINGNNLQNYFQIINMEYSKVLKEIEKFNENKIKEDFKKALKAEFYNQ